MREVCGQEAEYNDKVSNYGLPHKLIHDGMKLKTYEEVQEILAENSLSPKYKYKFFNELERAVYGFDLNAKAGLPTSNPNEFRESRDLPRPRMNEITDFIPYWEIHYFEEGFTTDEKNTSQWFSKTGIQDHFYFTLRSKIPVGYYDSLNITTRSHITSVEPSYHRDNIKSFHVGTNKCKINKNYTSDADDQPEGFDIYILDDDQDNFDFLKSIISGDIWNCLSYKGKILECKPSELPQMMFLSHGSTFIAKTENVDSIVCLDRFTNLSTNEEGKMLILKGNTFLNQSALVLPTRYGNSVDSYLGKNTVFGCNCMIRSIYIEDHVVVSNEVDVDIETYLKRGCIITEGVKIIAHQEILPGQKVTVTVPLFLNLIHDDRGISIKDFLRKSESGREHFLKNEIPILAK